MPPIPEMPTGDEKVDLWVQAQKHEGIKPIASGTTVEFLTDYLWEEEERITVTLSGGLLVEQSQVAPWFIPDNLFFLTQAKDLAAFQGNWGIGLKLDRRNWTISLTNNVDQARVNLAKTAYSTPIAADKTGIYFRDEARAVLAGLTVLSEADFRLAGEKGLLVIVPGEHGIEETLALPGKILHGLDGRTPADDKLVIMEFDWGNCLEEQVERAKLLRSNLDKLTPVGVVFSEK